MSPILIALLLLHSATTAADGPSASITRLDGATIQGKLRSWDEKQFVVETAEGDQHISANQLLSIRWPPVPSEEKAAETAAPSHAELLDGSRVPITDIQCSGRIATLTPAIPVVGDVALDFRTRHLSAVQLTPLGAAAAAQWREIRDLSLAADLLVLLKRDGQSLDYVEGTLGDVTSHKINFKLDGKPVQIDRQKVAGFVYYRRENESLPEARAAIFGRSGLRANAVRVELQDDLLKVTTTGGAELRWPIADIYLADFSAGKLIYLSDIDPASERWTPLVGLPSAADTISEFGQPRRDKSAYGGPLTLAFVDASGLTSTRPQQFNKGLALRSRTELVYRLPAGFRRMSAVAGIDPTTSASGSVRLEIQGDDRKLLDSEISGQEPPQPIDLDIAGVKRLKIIVDYGQNLDSGDWLNLCDARIIK